MLVAEGGDVADLPDSLRAVIAARLDQLPPDQRAALDNAAMLGPSGPLSALHRFAEKLGQRLDMNVFDGLVDSGLLSVDGRRWQFVSDSVREVAYNTLTKAVRAARHIGVAKSMGDHNANPDDVAHHLASAAEIASELGSLTGVPVDVRDQALAALEAAASRAIEQGNLRQIVRYSTRAIDLFESGTLTDADRNRRSALRVRRLGAWVELRQLDRARPEADAVLAEALAEGDEFAEACAHRARGLINQATGDLDAARKQLGDSIELFRTLGDRAQLAETLRLRGFLELFGGSLADGEWFFGEAAGIYTELEDRRGLGYIEQHRAWSAFLSGNMLIAEEHLHGAADTFRELGDRAGVGWALGLLAFVEFYNRRFSEAEELATTVRSEAKERGDEWAEGMMISLLAAIRLWTGHLDAAAALAEQARSKFKRLGDAFGLAQTLAVLGRAQVALGDANSARTSETLVSNADLNGQTPFAYIAAAGMAMHAGDGRSAVTLADEAIAAMSSQQGNGAETWIIAAMGLAQSGEYDQARTSLAHVIDEAQSHPFYISTAALVSVLEGLSADAIDGAEAVSAAAVHSYLDGVVASIAAGAASAALDDEGGARRWLEDAINQATATQDIIATALALAAYERVIGFPHQYGSGDLDVLGTGWRSVIDALPTIG